MAATEIASYLFSNTLAPVIAATSLKVLDSLRASTERQQRLFDNATHFRSRMSAAGFDLLLGEHPIIPVMLRDPKLAQDMAVRLVEKVSMSHHSVFPSCHRVSTAFVPRCRRRTAARSLIRQLMHSYRLARTWD